MKLSEILNQGLNDYYGEIDRHLTDVLVESQLWTLKDVQRHMTQIEFVRPQIIDFKEFFIDGVKVLEAKLWYDPETGRIHWTVLRWPIPEVVK